MIERRRIVAMSARGSAAALLTLVRVEGSSYRRPGARLLLGANGDYAGSISGGCLEAELIQKAQWKVRNGPVVERYSTLFDDTAEIPYGLGCGGTVDLLLEPTGTPEFAVLLEAMRATLRGESRRVLTGFDVLSRQLSRAVYDAEGRELFASAEQRETLFDERLDPPQRLVIFGAGDDAKPLAEAAARIGWTVAIVDGRTQLARPDRFPDAEQIFTSASAANVRAKDAVAVMTHSYEQDRAALVAVLPRAPRYLGLLGARHRSALLMGEAAAILNVDLAQVCEQISAPMGFDLGGDGPEAIALASLAEMHATVEGRIAAPRRMNLDSIREQIASGGASKYLQTQCALG